MTAPPVRLEALTKRYGSTVAVEELSFEVAAGRITGLLGRNGAGKTTSLRALLGLVAPTSGRALVFGQRYSELGDPRRVGVSLDGIGTLPGVTVAGELRTWATALHLPPASVDRALAEVGLDDVAGRRVAKLSQGMRQRLSLATAFLADPELIVLDEPATGLDPSGIRWLRTVLRERAGRGATILLSSHLLAEVEETVDDVVIIDRRLHYAGPLTDLTAGGTYRLEDRFFTLIESQEETVHG
ncbi:ABC-2 type transport system ATP-binding protein [Georgenia satyanarayanai]|uniref:ABC-2 type transport system ATP-binding protein n=1 Tax=Georgenia satyanarayanai TaxID=860221 RepID=A0A2Y9AJU5_9MICO|nr:ATP-binding cassette domain-containing protein [Georgenia satyanarayanai]PYF98936.1 ABC-2 type transport system ATP-binding protein [Georgenia satyanarayanai]SSA44784.1 ABC-2 type transport system ATP-binding protein [Georgenia satyanarayanai]